MSGLNSKIYPTVWLFEGFEYPVLNFIEIGSGDQSQGMPETLINELKEGEQFRYKGLLVDSERQVSFLQLERVPAQKTIDCPLDAVRSYSQMSLKENERKGMNTKLEELARLCQCRDTNHFLSCPVVVQDGFKSGYTRAIADVVDWIMTDEEPSTIWENGSVAALAIAIENKFLKDDNEKS